jgi:hypothetical protein
MLGVQVAVTASTPGCPTPKYEFWVLAPGASSYMVGQPHSTNPVFNWKTAGLSTGSYRITVWVEDASSSGVFGNPSGRWDAYDADLLYTLTAGCPSVSYSASPSSPVPAGTGVIVTASSPGCPNPSYEFWLLAPGASTYALAQPYSNSAVFKWDTGNAIPGTYRVTVWVQDASSSGTYGNASGRWDAYNATLLYTLT